MKSAAARRAEDYPGRHEASSVPSDYRFVILLSLLTLYLITLPVLSQFSASKDQSIVSFLANGFFVGMLIAAVYAVVKDRTSLIIAFVLAIPTIALEWVPLAYDAGAIFIVRNIFGIVFLLYVVLIVLRGIFTHNLVNVNTICASICVYFLLGVMWALAYSLLEFAQPHSFRLSTATEANALTIRSSDAQFEFALYYSIVTMTTLGYGDIVPASPTSRMLAALQALTGQLYLVVLVARRVGLHIAHSASVNTQSTNQD